MPRPSTPVGWATDANYAAGASDWSGHSTKVAPSAGKQASGLVPNTDQPAEELNWLWNLICLWILYFDAWLISVLNPTPPSVGVDSPQVLIKDAAGNARFLVSHNGFMGGSNNMFREEWKLPINTASAGSVTANPLWFLSVAGTPSGLATGAPTTVFPHTWAGVTALNTTNNKIVVSSATQWMNPGCTFASYELKLDVSMDAIGANGMTHWIGFSGSRDPSSPASGFAWFKKATGDTNWQCQTNDGATTNTVDSGVVPVLDSAGMQRLKIEVHGSTTAFGAKTVRFFINDVLVATSTINLPTATQYVVFGSLCTAGGSGHDMDVGAIELNVNRYAAGGTT